MPYDKSPAEAEEVVTARRRSDFGVRFMVFSYGSEGRK
jgi:hypothetical protein